MAYCSISLPKSVHIHLHKNPINTNLSSYSTILSFPSNPPLRLCALKARNSNKDSYGSELLRKPVTSPAGGEESSRELDDGKEEEEGKEDEWVDWEDRILEDTVPLVGFVRMILHSGQYKSGDRLSPEHERTILERLLPYHPECQKKIGSGVDYITIGYHPDFESSRCLFVVQKNGDMVDFSYWKCLKGLIRKNYPLYADSFILRHFRKRRRSDD